MNHTIKKYNNRKLYSTLENRYIKLDYIKDLIKQGHELNVLDNKTGMNITQVVMLKAYTESLNPAQFDYEQLKSMIKELKYPI